MTREDAIRQAESSGMDVLTFLNTLDNRIQPPKETLRDTDRQNTPPAERSPAPPSKTGHPTHPSGLPYFGYDVFDQVPNAFEPNASGPVDPEYLLGPDDVIRVAVWGEVEFEREYTIDHQGEVFIGTVGKLILSGLTLNQSYQKILKQLSRSYAGLTSDPPTVWLDVSLSKLQPKRVFIMGEVRRPGGYIVNSYATVFNALYSIGGPTTGGSLREVRLLRNGKLVTRVDLYDYLLGNETVKDQRVQTNDVIFVPPRGKTVTIRGGVRRPGAYEIRDGEDLGVLVVFSGGLLPEAYAPKAQITRIRPWADRQVGVEDRIVLDVDLKALLRDGDSTGLEDGDEVQVFTVLDVLRNYAVVKGSVWRPGRYELGEIQTVKDLVNAAEGTQPKTLPSFAHLVRFNEDEITTRIISINLGRALEDPEYSLRLMPRDELIVYSEEILEEKDRYVIIRGAVRNPGRYPYRDNLTLQDLVPIAGGYSEGAEIIEAEISRFLPGGAASDTLVTILRVPLPDRFVPDDERAAEAAGVPFFIRHRDEVLILTKPNFLPQQNVAITGDMMYPGVYAIQHRGERLSDLLHRAGGPTSSTFLGGAMFYRDGRRVLVDFEQAFFMQNRLHDIMMMGGDSIDVPSHPHTVFVFGEVNKPGLLSFLEGDDVSEYIDRAGGLKDSAYYVVLTRPTGESRRVDLGLFSSDPRVSEGSIIEVVKEPPPPPPQQQGDFFGTVKDIFALLASVAAVIFIVHTTAN